MIKESVILPKELTAENGAKYLLSGEFYEELETVNPDYLCDGCRTKDAQCKKCPHYEEPEILTRKVPIQWTTIKSIYKKIVLEMAL